MVDQPRWPDDALALKNLRDRGDDLITPRHTLAFFYLPEDDKRDPANVFRSMGPNLEKKGWKPISQKGKALVVDSIRAVDPASVDAMSESLRATGAEFRVEYMGWNCAVVAKKN